jgi:CRISPR-associated DxTHG motif protein
VQLFGPFDKVVILVTKDASDKHELALKRRLLELLPGTYQTGEGPCNDALSFVPISEITETSQLWNLFSVLGQQLQPGDRVSFDVTHGFRMFPQVALLALGFYRHTKRLAIEAIHYGAYEALKEEKEDFQLFNRRMSQGEFRGKTAPIFDLTPMFVLPSWAEAVADWKRTGRAEGLLELVKPQTSRIKKAEQKQAPASLVALPASLEKLDLVTRIMRHDKFAGAALEVEQNASQAREQIRGYDELRPLDEVLEDIALTAHPLTRTSESTDGTDLVYLQHQIVVARWYTEHGYVVEPFSLLRECIGSCGVFVLARLGIGSLAEGKEPMLLGSKDFREQANYLLVAAGDSFKRRSAKSWQLPVISQVQRLPASWLQEMADVASRIKKFRNKLDHCWTDPALAVEKLSLGGGKDLGNLVEKLALLVDQMAELPLGAPVVQEAGAFVNLSNHSVASWTEPQRLAAAALGHGEPVDLLGGMPLVDPEADEEQVEQLAASIAQRAREQGARGAHVATDFGLTWALVRALQKAGLPCYQATTKRVVEETQVAQGTEKRAIFSFVRWRRYV